MYPVIIYSVQVLLSIPTLMIHIKEYIKGMRCFLIEPRIFCGWLFGVKIEVHQHIWIWNILLIHYDVENYCNTLCMTFINEFLEFVFRPIVFVGREHKCRIVSPTVISIEFSNRHELNCVNAEPFKISECIDQVLII